MAPLSKCELQCMRTLGGKRQFPAPLSAAGARYLRRTVKGVDLLLWKKLEGLLSRVPVVLTWSRVTHGFMLCSLAVMHERIFHVWSRGGALAAGPLKLQLAPPSVEQGRCLTLAVRV